MSKLRPAVERCKIRDTFNAISLGWLSLRLSIRRLKELRSEPCGITIQRILRRESNARFYLIWCSQQVSVRSATAQSRVHLREANSLDQVLAIQMAWP